MKKRRFQVKDLIENYGKMLGIQSISNRIGHKNLITIQEAQRPGLALLGYSQRKLLRQILIFGTNEIEYLKSLSSEACLSRLSEVITHNTPVVILSKGLKASKEITKHCRELNVALLRSNLKTMHLLTQLTLILKEAFSPIISVHGTLVEVFGMGVLIEGDSSVGKSEAALGLIEKGHRLVSDDVVHLRKKANQHLEGSGPELTRHMLEVRGIGILNIAHLYGAVSVRQNVQVDVSIQLEEWDNNHFYDRVGLEERFKEVLDILLPCYTLPVKPGRDIVLLIETTVLNHRLKEMGYHSAKDFNVKLLHEISRRQEKTHYG